MFARTLSDTAQATLALLGKSGLVQNAYLAGGSALALHYGHRISVDLDFFSQKQFIPSKLEKSLKQIGTFHTTFAKGISLLGEFQGTKFSYFQYEYPLIAKTTSFNNVAIAHPHDIASMKLVAIVDRSTKKDFVDLYELTKHDVSMDRMMGLYEQKYHVREENMYTLIRALRYFDEIDKSTMPEMLVPRMWDDIKRFFIAESVRLAKKYLEE